MKLFSKYSRIHLSTTVIIFICGSAAFALLLKYIIISQVDDDLLIEKREIETYIAKHHQLPEIVEVHDQYTSITPSSHSIAAYKIFTASGFNKKENEKNYARNICFSVALNNHFYIVTVSKSLEGSDALIQSIILITVSLILLILAADFIINKIVLKKLWQPFYHSLMAMRLFKLTDNNPIHLPASSIDEFILLNNVLNDLLSKARRDYLLLKEFTANASHELQTPLAIIRAKLDMLLQSETLSPTQLQAMQAAYESIKNLSKLNKSLLLLAKIENGQFNEQAQVDFLPLIQKKINEFADWWGTRQIRITQHLQPSIVQCNAQLATILFNNLFSNATQHNIPGGEIHIHLCNTAFTISNTGIESALDAQKIFSRFYKQHFSGNHGLGLSIVKQVCDSSAFTCSYSFSAPQMHSFTISFSV